MIRSQKQLRRGRDGWGTHEEAAGKRQRRIIRCGALKAGAKKVGKAKLPWRFLSEGRISVGVDVVSRVAIEFSPGKERGPRRKYARGRNRP